MQNADVVLDALHSLGMKRMVLQRAYRLLYNPALYTYTNPDGSPAVRDELIRDLRHQRFRWGQCPDRDRWLSQVLVLLLTTYLRAQDPPQVHGLRDGSGLHSALKAGRQLARHAARVCVLDLHSLLAYRAERVQAWLAPAVEDRRFTDLVARYFDVFPEPEVLPGAVLSGTMRPDSLHGLICHWALGPLDAHLVALRRSLDQARRARSQARRAKGTGGNTVSRHTGFVRYLNQVLIALPDHRDDTMAILQEVTAVLHTQGLDLTLQAMEPVSLPESGFEFLGYEFRHAQARKVSLLLPEPKLQQVCQPFLRQGKPVSLGHRTRFGDERIQAVYRAEFDAVSQYYALAENRHRLRFWRWALRASMYRTLAQKHKCHVSDIARHAQQEQGSDRGLPQTIPGTQFQVRWIDDVQWRDPWQVQAGEPCAVKVACTVRREVAS